MSIDTTIEQKVIEITINDGSTVQIGITGGFNTITTALETTARTIYIESAGDDTDGDGTSVSTAFATISRALQDVKTVVNADITFEIGGGTFSLSGADVYRMGQFRGSGRFIWNGQISLLKDGFVTAQDTTYPFKYNVTEGGVPATWTVDQYRGMLMRSGSIYYPINGNDASVLYMSRSATWANEIFQHDTIINFDPNVDHSFSATINLSWNITNIKINFLDEAFFQFLGPAGIGQSATFTSCNFTATGSYQIAMRATNKLDFFYCHFDSFSRLALNVITDCNLRALSINTSVTTACLIINGINTRILIGLTIRNIGANGRGLGLYSKIYNLGVSAIPMYFRDTSSAIEYGNNAIIDTDNGFTPYLENVDYLFRAAVSLALHYSKKLVFASLPVQPDVRISFDTRPHFVDLSKNSYIYVKGIEFPEIEKGLSSSLANNTTTNIAIANINQNEYVKITYSATRSTEENAGTYAFRYDGTNLIILTDEFAGDDIGLTFDVDFDGVDANIINLECTVTDNVNAITFDYDVERIDP